MEGPGQPVEGLFLGSAGFPGFRLAFAKGLCGRIANAHFAWHLWDDLNFHDFCVF
jgi:hypothetical protein